MEKAFFDAVFGVEVDCAVSWGSAVVAIFAVFASFGGGGVLEILVVLLLFLEVVEVLAIFCGHAAFVGVVVVSVVAVFAVRELAGGEGVTIIAETILSNFHVPRMLNTLFP